jgi:hypothetical protein
MRALSNLIAVNDPQLVLFVGEALVGNDAVDQLTKFSRALQDLAPSDMAGGSRRAGRGVDGIVLTKFDTIDDKVGWVIADCARWFFDTLPCPKCFMWLSNFKAVLWPYVSRQLTALEPPPGGRCPIYGLQQRCSHHVCGVRSNVRGSEEAQCQERRQLPAEVVCNDDLRSYF